MIYRVSRIVVLLIGGILALPGQAVPGPIREAASLELPLAPQLYDYHAVDAFPGMTFVQPVRTVAPPGVSDRLFVVEQEGRITLITDFGNPRRSLFLDLTDRVHFEQEGGLLDLAFHPRFRENGLFFVFYTLDDTSAQGSGLHDRLSRFRVMEGNPERADPESEAVLINQFDRHIWHNAGCLEFGPDGYLYVSLGDEGWGEDALGNAQRIGLNFFSGILRLDVDMREGNLAPNPHPASIGHYLVPADNPFVGIDSFNGLPVPPRQVRTEFHAVGFRNPWRFSFDPETGNLYCNDAGQITREEINLVVPGGNYGWSHVEGSFDGPRWESRPEGIEFLPPLVEYGRQYGDGIAGGLFYWGDAVPGLDGHYLFSDFWAGFLGAFRHDGEEAGPVDWFLWEAGISSIGIHPATGDILLSDWTEGRIKRLVEGPDPALDPLPRLLSETGAFSDLESLTPAPGVIPYEINVPFWSDHADKRRWFALPGLDRHLALAAPHDLSYPAGTVWVKQFDIRLQPDAPDSVRRLETRFMVQTPFGIPYGVTYRWNEEGTDAELVPGSGLDEVLVREGGEDQLWRYPSRRECFSCHNGPSGGILGFTVAQLNRTTDYGSGAVYQLQALDEAGFFQPPLEVVHTLPALAHPDDTTQSLEYRVRSYLEANCSGCHHPDGIAEVDWDARTRVSLDDAGIIHGPADNQLGNSLAAIVTPGSIDHSVLFERLGRNERGRMPPLATRVLDTRAVDLLREWIDESLPWRLGYSRWQALHFAGQAPIDSFPWADPDGDNASNRLEYLTGTDPLLDGDAWRVNLVPAPDGSAIRFHQLPNRRYQVQWTRSLTPTVEWRPLDIPENRVFFSAEPFWKTIDLPSTSDRARFYRVLVDDRNG